jgi:RNA polymerase sigma-70 factor (ECF subfamily)
MSGLDADPDHLTHVQGLFLQNLPALRGFLLSLVSDFSLVDDIVQETFLTVTAKATGYQRGSNFRAWTWTIARFKALQAIENALPLEQRFEADVVDALCAHQSAETWFAEDQLSYLTLCLKSLAPKALAVIELRYQQAHLPQEIARRMGWTVDSVHVALSRARVVLRDCITERMASERL